MTLTTEQIQHLLDLLSHEVVTEFDGYKVMKRGMGYSNDPFIAKLQARLSIMLQVKSDMQ